MGQLAGRMVLDVFRPHEEQQFPDEIDEPWLGFTFTVETDAESVDRFVQELRALVDARNDLIHHFLPHWQAAVDGDVDNALAYLDAQLDETLRMKDRLEKWAKTMDEAKKQMANFFSSPECAHQIKLGQLQSSRLIAMLGEIAMRTARPDGWAILATAANLIKREAPDELQNLNMRFGYRNLKGVLLAAEFFDMAEEPTPGGGVRTIYRINDRFELTLTKVETAD